ncbi:hypothetical protein [Microcoleus sp. MON1_C5]|uniref:hypothetical protein n=1 Tax=Microcoleus sp. MON1_C5 TaxID=2818828 RepID=UPI002FD2DC89
MTATLRWQFSINYTDGKVSISGQHEETPIVRAGGLVELLDTIDLGQPIALDGNITDLIDRTRDRSPARGWHCPLQRWHYRSQEHGHGPVWIGATLCDRESKLATIRRGNQTTSDCRCPRISSWEKAVLCYDFAYPQSAKIG